MRLLNNVLGAAVLLCIFAATNIGAARATAILLVDGNGQLTGAQHLEISGTPYDVIFLEGTCIALFDGCDAVTDFDFQDEIAATAAVRALAGAFKITGSGGV